MDRAWALAAVAASLAALITVFVDWRRRRGLAAVKDQLLRAEMSEERLRALLRTASNLNGLDLAGMDLRGVDLGEKDMREANLARCLLAGADLSGSQLHGVVLTGADLSGANLANADLTAARLDGASLETATLVGAILARASLRDADLSGARLSRADFTGALLRGAELRGADLSGASFAGADLAEAHLPSSLELSSVLYDEETVWPERTAAVQRKPTVEASPVVLYIAIDVSASMAGAPIESVEGHVEDALFTVLEDSTLAQRTWFSVTVFSDEARVVVPLTNARDFAGVPELEVGGGTSYTPILELLLHQLDEDEAVLDLEGPVAPPMILFISDGVPRDDDWEDVVDRLQHHRRRPQVIALGIGDADPAVIKRVGFSAALHAADLRHVIATRSIAAVLASVIGVRKNTERGLDGISLPRGVSRL